MERVRDDVLAVIRRTAPDEPRPPPARPGRLPRLPSVAAVDEAAEELVCVGCGLAYPVRDDIPVLLVDEARDPA